MVTRKEDTPKRISNRKYEEKNKEERRKLHANFQTMIPRKDYEKIDLFLKTHNISKVELIFAGYRTLMLEQEEKTTK